MNGAPQPVAALTADGSHEVPVPRYDRARVRTGIVHVGVGGFHRAHEAVYVDDLLARGETDWGICGVGTQPGDRRIADILREQDGLYTLVVKHPDGRREPRVIGSIVEYLYAPDDPEAVIERMAAPSTRIVSLTITEGGYLVDPATGLFAPIDPQLLRDLTGEGPPATVFGLVVEALARRRARGTPPFTVLSCDNVQGNGDVARAAFAGFAERRDRELGSWVRDHVAFPNSMVDRITPATTDDDRAQLRADAGVDDGWPVVCEPYQQWVLEDAFCNGRPPWEQVGVQLVPDVRPYELMKLRLLNAGHQVLGHLGSLVGYRYVDEACSDPVLRAFLLAYMEHEATPTLDPVPGIDLEVYRRSLVDRFSNAHVRDTLDRLRAETSDRIPTFLLPVVRDQRAAGGPFRRSALVVAAWARVAAGADDHGEPLQVVDRLRDTLIAAAAAQQEDPTAFITRTGLFGDLATDEAFLSEVATHIESLRRHGARRTAELVT